MKKENLQDQETKQVNNEEAQNPENEAQENNEEVAEEQGTPQDDASSENVPEEEAQEQNARSEEDEFDKLKREAGEAKEKFLRLYSEFENYKRRTAKERGSLIESANKDLLSELLPVLDDFERAEKSMNDDSDLASIKEGVDLIYTKFKKTLEKKGVKPIEAQKGDDFDTEIHEAVTQYPAGDELKGKIVDVIEKGYYLGSKVIRFAKVVVGA